MKKEALTILLLVGLIMTGAAHTVKADAVQIQAFINQIIGGN